MAFLKPGRLVQVSVAGKDWGTGVVVAVCRKPPGGMHGKPAGGSAADAYVVDTLLECAAVDGSQGRPCFCCFCAVLCRIPARLQHCIVQAAVLYDWLLLQP